MKFRLKAKAGRHIEGGRVYQSGEVVESFRNLVDEFPEKFERVDAPEGKERTVLQDGSNRTVQPTSSVGEELTGKAGASGAWGDLAEEDDGKEKRVRKLPTPVPTKKKK